MIKIADASFDMDDYWRVVDVTLAIIHNAIFESNTIYSGLRSLLEAMEAILQILGTS